MTGIAGNGRNAYSGYNPLCDTLRAKYSDRVRRAANVAAPGGTALSYRQDHSAGAGRRPTEVYAASAPRSSVNGTDYRQPARAFRMEPGSFGDQTGANAGGEEMSRRGYTPRRTVYGQCAPKSMSGAPNRTGSYQTGGSMGTQSSVRRRTDRYEAPRAKVKKQSFVVSAARHFKEKIADSNREARRQKAAEIKLTKKPFPKGAMLCALICTVMLMVMLFSYAQVYEMNRTISRQRSAGEALVDEAEKLQVELELKDDIRTIERIATEEIGMVKSDRVDTRYISVSGGERIDVIESPEEQTGGVNMFTTLLSAIGENFEKILDRIE